MATLNNNKELSDIIVSLNSLSYLSSASCLPLYTFCIGINHSLYNILYGWGSAYKLSLRHIETRSSASL